MKPVLCVALAAIVVLVFSFNVSAQQKTNIENVHSISMRNSGPIMYQDEIQGYYLFYQSDQIDNSTNEYTLQILDQNLNKLRNIKFNDSKTLQLLESTYNGSRIMFMFYDKENQQLEYRVYADNANKAKLSYTKPLSDKSTKYMETYMRYMNEEGQSNTLFPVGQRGFLTMYPIREGKQFSYEVSFFSSDKKKTWTYMPMDANKRSMAQYLGCSDSIAVIELMKYDGARSKKASSFLLGLNLFNGKKVFEVPTDNEEFKLLPMYVSLNNDSSAFNVIGPYYDSDDRLAADKNLGLAIWTFSKKGKILSKKYNSWAGDISKFLKTDDKGKVEGIGYLFLHDIIQTSEGKTYAVGEGFGKAFSAGGALLTAGGILMGQVGGTSAVKLRVTDLVLLEFDKQFNISNATIYDKQQNNIMLPMGSAYSSPHILGTYVKYALGGFDYTFTQKDKDKTNFAVGFTDYERSKDYKGLTFHSISYYDNSFSTDKINLKTSASSLKILPGKPGSILIMEYFKKEKKLDMRMEKMN